jgi:hypothetical protein
MVSPNEGNEVRRDEWQGVGASHSTDEVWAAPPFLVHLKWESAREI